MPDVLQKINEACCAEGSVLKERFDNLETKVDKLIVSTDDIIEFHHAANGAMKFFVAVGTILNFCAKVLLAMAAIYVVLKSITAGDPGALKNLFSGLFTKGE